MGCERHGAVAESGKADVDYGFFGRAANDRNPEGPSTRGRRDSSAGATVAASGPHAVTRAGASATDVPPCAATGAAVEPARARIALAVDALAVQAARPRAWRVARSTRSEAQRRECSVALAAGQFVERGRRSRTRDGHQDPRSPVTGRAAFDMAAGAAGLSVLLKGLMPVGIETRSGSMRSTTARSPALGTRPGGQPTADR